MNTSRIQMSEPSEKSLRGRFLLASRELNESSFARSVVLIVQHDEHGTLGLVINRPTNISVKQAIEQASEINCFAEGFVHEGGPCEGPAMLLHNNSAHSQIEPLPGVHFTADPAHIETLLVNPPEQLKCFAGYAGWGGGQLERELSEGAWIIFNDVTPDQIFADPEPSFWNDLMTRATMGRWVDPKRIPNDPNLN